MLLVRHSPVLLSFYLSFQRHVHVTRAHIVSLVYGRLVRDEKKNEGERVRVEFLLRLTAILDSSGSFLAIRVNLISKRS